MLWLWMSKENIGIYCLPINLPSFSWETRPPSVDIVSVQVFFFSEGFQDSAVMLDKRKKKKSTENTWIFLYVKFKETASHTFNLLRGVHGKDVLSRVLRFKWRKGCWEGREIAQNDGRPGLSFTTKFDGKKFKVEDSCEDRSSSGHQDDSRGVEYWQRNGENNRNNKFEAVANPDPKVRSSRTVKCHIVYASARRDLHIRIRHWFQQFWRKLNNMQIF